MQSTSIYLLDLSDQLTPCGYFAILDDHNAHQKHNPEGNYKPFAEEFAGMDRPKPTEEEVKALMMWKMGAGNSAKRFNGEDPIPTKTKGILLEPETEHLLATVIVPSLRWRTINIRHANLKKTGKHYDIEKLLEAMKA